MLLQITDTIQLQENEITLEFVRSSGPGGQNVNKVATAVKLYFHVGRSPSLPEEVKNRLHALAVFVPRRPTAATPGTAWSN
jgi:ribosome-associated protein